ncbi:MAG: hypothetical protein ACKVOJ_13525 [Sphingomonadaceae bacterium]
MKQMLCRSSLILCVAAATLAGCGGGNSTTPPPPVVAPPPPPAPANVTISGLMTFDRVPNNRTTNTLDYANIRQAPIRRHVVEALDGAGAVIATTSTDMAGRYSVTVASNTPVQMRVRAQLLSTSGATYNVQVLDNTNANAPYILAGSLVSSGAANSTRDLNAASGWGGASYTGPRAAGPFAISDSALEPITAIVAVDPTVTFTPLNILWSPNNRPADGNLSNGDIGTSFFSSNNGQPFIALLGAADTDTDEYDSHVIVHEFGHYVEGTLSRSDSIGGSHTGTAALDSRVAFGEGFGNAFSGMMLLDPIYRDSFGPRQASGFAINVENNVFSPTGWFNEGSTASILYDIFDSNSDGADTISAGFGPIYRAFRDDAYRNTPLITNIHSYLGAIATQPGVPAAGLDALIAQQSIGSRRADAVGETNNGGISFILPFYKTVTVGGPPVTVCSTNVRGIQNRLGNYDFARLTIPSTRSVTVTVRATSGPALATTDPLFEIYRRGTTITSRDISGTTVETQTLSLAADDYVIAVASFVNTTMTTSMPNGDQACYDLTVQ